MILPNEVKVIGAYAFEGQKKIKNLTLSNGLTTLDNASLVGTSINSLSIPKSVNSISTSTFVNLNVNVTIAADNQKYMVLDNMFIVEKDGNRLITVSKDLETYNIPTTIQTIGRMAFYYKRNLKSIIIPNSVKVIEGLVFDYCANLQKIEIQSSVESIGSNAFSRCNNLTEIIIHKGENDITGSPWGCPYGLRAVKWVP